MKIEIKNTNILDMVTDEIYSSNIYITDDKITKIGDDPAFKADQIIDGKNYITMPGFINAHTHVAMSGFRNYGNDTDLMTWLNDYIFPAEEKLTKEMVYANSLLSMAEMIKTGTTTFADMYFFEEETIRALEKAGLRAQISRGITAPDEGKEKINECLNLYKTFNGRGGKLEIALGPHAVYTTDKAYLREVADIAKEYQIPIHTHLSETKVENEECLKRFGQTPTEVYAECGLFDGRAIAAHGVHLTDDDLDILAEKNVSIIHNPSSNLKLSSGILDVTRLTDKGINVALGTDSAASNNKQSMLKEIELAALISKLKAADNLKAYEVLKLATINGAKALGIDDKVGSLKEGKQADLIMIAINNINHTPANDLIASICYSTYESDITNVMIDGKFVLKDSKLVDLDEDEILVEVEKANEYVL